MPSFASFRLNSAILMLTGCASLCGCASMGGNMSNSSGMGYYDKGNYVAAASEFQTAMMNDPSNPDYMANFAKARWKMGDVAGAEQYFRQALTVSPSHQPSYHGLAELMLSQNRGQEAQAMLQTWAGTQPYMPESHVELAWLHRQLGNPQAAGQSLQQALQVNPNHAAALAMMGQQYEEVGRPDQAVAMYQQSLRSDWNQPDVHSRIAAVGQQAGGTSPMAATAMARGVHPYSIPRQETAFGPPSPGAQRAQMQMAMANPGMFPQSMSGGRMPQTGFVPGNGSGMMSSYYAPSMPMSVAGGGMTGWQAASGSLVAPTPSATAFANPPMMMNGPGATMSWPAESAPSFEIPATTPKDTAVAPTPDPAFSATKTPNPVQTVSSTSTVETPAAVVTSTAGSEPPLVEAF